MWELDYKEIWAPKNWCFLSMVLEKTLESPLDSKDIKPVNPKGDQSWVFIGRTDAEAETPILWPPCEKSWLTGKDPDAGKYWRQEEKGMTEDEMTGWHHRLNGREFGWTWGVGDREAWRAVIHGVGKSWTRLSHWNELNWMDSFQCVLNTLNNCHNPPNFLHAICKSYSAFLFSPHAFPDSRWYPFYPFTVCYWVRGLDLKTGIWVKLMNYLKQICY